MRDLISKWRVIAAQYRQIKTPADDLADIASALLFTILAVLLGAAIADMTGGSHV